jgi:hypothetical protein
VTAYGENLTTADNDFSSGGADARIGAFDSPNVTTLIVLH